MVVGLDHRIILRPKSAPIEACFDRLATLRKVVLRQLLEDAYCQQMDEIQYVSGAHPLTQINHSSRERQVYVIKVGERNFRTSTIIELYVTRGIQTTMKSSE